jgi:hypothetical protein
MIRARMRIIADTSQGEVALLEAAVQQGPDTRSRARLLVKLSQTCRMAAIGALLVRADLSVYRRYLRRSAEHRRALLSLPREQLGDAVGLIAASEIGPYCDALASRAEELAREIAALSPAELLDDHEFEDDYWYARFLYTLRGATAGGDADAQRALERFEGSLRGDASARLDVCRALLGRDRGGLSEGMERLIEENRTLQKKREQGMIQGKDRYWTDRFICIEGLALLAIAEGCGIGLDVDYPTMPRYARHHGHNT